MEIKNKNILVTGGAGFVGSHLVEELIKLQSNMVVVDINLDKRSYLFTENLHKKSIVIDLDICDYKKLLALIKKYKIEFDSSTPHRGGWGITDVIQIFTED